MIEYQVKAIKNPLSKDIKYYPQIAAVSPMTLREVTNEIREVSTVSEADCKAVLSALQNVVIAALKRGQSVRLGDLGSFRPTICANGQSSADEVSASDIKRVMVRFTAGSRMKQEICTPQSQSFAKRK